MGFLHSFRRNIIAMLPLIMGACATHAPVPPATVPPSAPEITLQPPDIEQPLVVTEWGKASYYANKLDGKLTASGKPMDQSALTAASKYLPLGTVATITNLDTGKSVNVEVNDHGPYVPGRIIDLSKQAAMQLDMTKDGVMSVKVEARPADQPTPELQKKIAKLAAAKSAASAKKRKKLHKPAGSASAAQ